MEWLFLPIILQAIAMVFDELYFHRKRGLPLWERNGHPIDTFSVILCYLFLVTQTPTDLTLKIYIALCAFSCLLITKDEFVHTEHCEAAENWLHAVLFVLHPITFFASGIIWQKKLSPTFLQVQLLLLLFVMFYQIIYWRLLGKSKQ
jgi:hypothetical protein